MEEIGENIENIKNSDEKIEKTTSLRGLEENYIPSSGSISQGKDKTNFTSSKGTNIKLLYDTVKACPEAMACITAITEDIMADGWRFEGSKFQIKNVNSFIDKTNFYRHLTNLIVESLITGNGYLLKLAVSQNQIETIVNALTEKLASELKVKLNKKSIVEFVKQSYSVPKDLQILKSETVKINFDNTGLIKSFEQWVGMNKRVYLPEDVIQLNYINIGGQPYGFTPLETMLSDIATLIFAKEFAGSYFENDGIPTWIFKMIDAQPGDRNYELLKSELKELKKSKNKYKALLLTGNVESEQIQKFNKDMEFAKLIGHFTQIILMGWGVPAHRINYTIDVREVGGSVNRAYEGYYKKISFMQHHIENALNKELFWKYFRVKMRFKESYKIDEMREAQVVQILTQCGLVTVEEAREMVGLEPEKPKGTEPIRTAPTSIGNQGQQNALEQGRDNNGKTPDNTDNKLK